MSSEQYQRTVNSLDKEIADLEKKKAAKDKEVATLQGKINTLKKSINSHTSASTLNNKMRQIATHESDQAKKSQDSAELGKIDRGLAKSRYGVVILSPNYIAEHKYWTKAELNGLFQVETVNGKTILPIWHNLTKKQVVEYSPIIADRKAMTTASMTPEEIAAELKELFAPDDTEEQENG